MNYVTILQKRICDKIIFPIKSLLKRPASFRINLSFQGVYLKIKYIIFLVPYSRIIEQGKFQWPQNFTKNKLEWIGNLG